ncbi:AraC family transcriptional regulator [Sphingomonadales bacterium 56]|uniref:Helix-turn-helix domain-containing protein n=1 Tax=Sphingobium agri TaxID=2933566 RepID=A0ABT0DSW3_9SPHN|nr:MULTISPECIES: helix-turn-helix domain-containing protein [Sphingobium]MBY2930341.1 AraC family transcriptional regulator [Sphingomonadales bacterium 56]MBY2960385.1 AraC family transcriptional regulator [Sphingomonadales bacterium 58]MCK0530173.1 helix-turn-helix domain-containing protein [Sphingobium agri]CAD7341004.1 HTH-type transcriptional activator RhaS [Sphingobium sp. S8]CAD7341117.1 HTH-type transcriptional activator RhaS [Sphingobium sp. S6]
MMNWWIGGENVALAAGAVVAALDIQATSRPSLDTRTYLFRKAREYILNRITQHFSVAELCEALRVSQRTLEYSFADIAALSPKRYILTQRLNRVRSDILQRGAAADVLDLAHKWGFHHPSRFSQQYRRHFHELPSVTKGRLIARLGKAESGRVSN